MRFVKLKKHGFITCLNRYRNCRNDENRIEMVEARTALKKSVRHFRYECKKQKQKKHRLLDLKYKNTKYNWKLFKDSQHSDSSSSLSASKFHNYFKSINHLNTGFTKQMKTFYMLVIVSSNQKYKSCLQSWMLKYLKKK